MSKGRQVAAKTLPPYFKRKGSLLLLMGTLKAWKITMLHLGKNTKVRLLVPSGGGGDARTGVAV